MADVPALPALVAALSKPLELRVFPKVPMKDYPGELGYVCGRWTIAEWSSVFGAKKLSDAELAAETYRQMTRAIGESGMVTDGQSIAPSDAATFGPMRRETSRLGDLKRFATLPHAGETDYA